MSGVALVRKWRKGMEDGKRDLFYFFDPDGILLEFAGWTRALGEGDVRHKPATAADKERYLAMAREARRS